MARLVIVDYGSGNLPSVERALQRCVHEAGLSVEITSSDRSEAIESADRIVIPGVGHFADCKRAIDARPGLTEALNAAVGDKARPVLGICVGMQLMATNGLEDGDTPGFGWIPGTVGPLKPSGNLPVPHMGWNELTATGNHPVLAGLPDDAHAYFVHSYAYDAANRSDVIATSDHGGPFAAIIARDTLVGTQFHPEKSQQTGLRVLTNWLNWTP